MKSTHTMGSDPEFFLRRKKDGKLISAVDVLTGTKDAPQILKSGGGLHYDNVAAEFSTEPKNDVKSFIGHIQDILADVHRELPDDLEIINVPSALFDEDQLQTEEAKAFGCSPDYDAWAVAINIPPQAEDFTMRSCGGHIHVGYMEKSGNDFLLDPMGKVRTVRVMDLFHGVCGVLLDRSEEAIRRRELYGKAGCHRPTEYGVEYRVLSNFWFKSPQLVMLMSSLTEDALAVLRDNKDEELIEVVGGGELIQEAINKGDTEKASGIWEVISNKSMSADSTNFFEECSKGIENFNFHKEWAIGG